MPSRRGPLGTCFGYCPATASPRSRQDIAHRHSTSERVPVPAHELTLTWSSAALAVSLACELPRKLLSAHSTASLEKQMQLQNLRITSCPKAEHTGDEAAVSVLYWLLCASLSTRLRTHSRPDQPLTGAPAAALTAQYRVLVMELAAWGPK